MLLGGKGERFGGNVPKQFQHLGSLAVYEHALQTFAQSGFFDEIILVTERKIEISSALVGDIPCRNVLGGATRQQSSYQGINACPPDTDYVVIHDGVRPFVSESLLEQHVECVMRYHAVNTCIPSPNAINLVDGGISCKIFPRETVMLGQTPQSFAYDLILEAHEKTPTTNACDDCSLVLERGHKVHIVIGEQKNLKITSQLDLEFAKTLLYTNAK